MKLTILGMNGPYPAPGGACSGYLLDTGTEKLQLDLGTGCLSALTALTAPEELDALFFSHWHFDHCSDLLPLFYRLADAKAAGCAPLKVYGPEDPSMPVYREAAASPLLEMHTLRPGDTVTVGNTEVRVLRGRHPVTALMYRITSGGKTLAFTGDTNTTEDLPALAENADLLLADGLFTDALWAEGKPHLSASLCARLAKERGAKRLVITHLNPNIDRETLLKEARAILPDVALARCGMVCDF